jgi:hypothetical protein
MKTIMKKKKRMMKVQVQERRKGMKVMVTVERRRKINQLKRRQRPWRSPRKSPRE